MTETIFLHGGYLILPGRTLLGFPLAAGVAAVAWRAGWLSRTGFMAATACGALCVIGGWSWATLLIVYFVAASGLSRAGRDVKERRTRGLVSKGGSRDAAQVLANGGVYSVAAVLTTVLIAAPYVAWGAIGALAAASADTWATEVGVWLGGTPKSIITRMNVRSGESGGVTPAGILGSIAGAGWVAVAAVAVGFPRGLGLASVLAGVGGSIADSLLGATIQEKRWCDGCAEPTESTVHLCGSTTRRVAGIAGLDNDLVNLVSSFVGFLLGVIFYCIASSSWSSSWSGSWTWSGIA